MGNSVLISGAAKVAPEFLDIGKISSEAANKVGAIYQQVQARKDLEKRNQRAKVEGYLNNMPAGIELSKIPPAQQQAIDTWSKNQKMVYAEAAKNIGNYEVGSEEYVDAMTTMTSVKASFTNLDNNLTTFKVNKTEYLKSSSEGALSAGNDGAQGDLLARIYTDETGMSFDPNGNLSFIDIDGNETALNNIPDFFNKDFQSADALINMNSTIYNAGAKLDGPTKNMYRQKVLNMVKKGGRETLLSLATDDLIQQGGLGIVDQDLLYNPARHVELEQAVVESYMNILSNSANIGFEKKQTAARKASKGGNVKRQNVYGQNIDNELEIYGGDAQRVYSDITSALSDLDKVDILVNDPKGTRQKQKADAINRILLTVNKNASQLSVDKDNVIYIDEGDDEKGGDPGIDFQDKASIADYILEQIADEGSMNPDTIRLIRNKLLSSKPNTKTTTAGDPALI